jgi:hypothetical protein
VCDGLPLWVPYRTLNDAESSLVNSHPRRSDDKLVHVISIGELVKDIISEQKFVIEQLDNYIAWHRKAARSLINCAISGEVPPSL